MAVGGAIVSGVVAIKGARDKKKAGKEAANIGAANAAAEEASTAEEVKRMEADNARQQSLARARAAATGAGGATTDIYMEALEKSGKEEVDWLKEVGATKYSQALSGGRTAYNQAMAGMWGSYGKAGSSFATAIGGMS